MKSPRLFLPSLLMGIFAFASLTGCANIKLSSYQDGSKPNDGGLNIQIDKSKKPDR